MNENPLFGAIDRMSLELGDVVRHIIDNGQVHAVAENPFKGAACRVGDQLPVRPRKVRGRCHCVKISLAFRRMNRSAGELPIRHMQIVPAHGLIQLRNVIAANLMTQTS